MFDSIKGQDQAITHLTNALSRPVHTYLFLGSRGTYIEQAARIFAARLIDDTGHSDSRVLNQFHPDVIEFEPMGNSYRVKEDVRESMLAQSRKAPVEGAKQVLIVHDAHLLRSDSANTLLKSLEEPPEKTHWILIAPSFDTLLPTIKSRSFAIEFARLTPETIEKHLIEQGINEQRAAEVAKRSAGRIDRAQKLATVFAPISQIATEIIATPNDQASSIATNAQNALQVFEEISSDVIAANKNELETLKKEMKQSGYSDRVAQSIVTKTKSRIEASEKKLKSELMREFLDALQIAYTNLIVQQGVIGNTSSAQALEACETIEKHRKRLLYNPSDALFLESLFAAIFNTTKVNS